MKFEIETEEAVDNSAIATKVTFICRNDDGSDKKRICVVHAGDYLKISNPDAPIAILPYGTKDILIPFSFKEE